MLSQKLDVGGARPGHMDGDEGDLRPAVDSRGLIDDNNDDDTVNNLPAEKNRSGYNGIESASTGTNSGICFRLDTRYIGVWTASGNREILYAQVHDIEGSLVIIWARIMAEKHH